MNQNRSRDQTLRVLSQQRVICNRNTAKKIAELRENARSTFWSGALAFNGPKIMFLHDKHEELLVEKSSFILCTFVWSFEIWQNSAYKRNTKYNVLYAGGYKRKKIQLERKFSNSNLRDQNYVQMPYPCSFLFF